MESKSFKASSQYNDWNGSVAADGTDLGGFSSVLQKKGLISEGEGVFGIELYSCEKFVSIEAFVGTDEDNLRKVDVDMTLEEFFKNFKRFSATLSRKGGLEGKEISYK